MASPKHICVHGHFYQPPRENPWLEDIEVQDSAHPYHNWNERIAFECYAPNTASRLMDAEGRITDIVSNYRKISFNFGPTLLSWLERRMPDVHEKIVEADRLSAKDRDGHGNALAQVYNHIIMPLASRRDKITQVRWGLADFERRFGRKPEGMWLAETAVDTETLEILADHGITFTILAPNQAARVRPAGGEWTDASGGKVDPSRAYRWTSPSGKSIALFFYDSPISHAVAFEGLLNDGGVFARRLMDGFSAERRHPQLTHIATDGESYGHHHRFGDMALAYALRKIESGGDVALTNHGQFLAKHPPEWDAEVVENSSWSCAHGVERWNSDCGCRIGYKAGWNQAWRGPLRKALNGLRDGLDALYEKHAPAYFKDPWAARDGYISLVLDRSSDNVSAFLAKHQASSLEGADRASALKLLEAQRQRLLMFTSCAWFFDEISGIETVAVLCFAARALQLVQDHAEALALEQAFMEGLALAQSNIPSHGTGESVYRRFVTPVITDLPRVAAHEALESLFGERPLESSLYCYHVRRLEGERREAGGVVLSVGKLRVTSLVTEEVFETSYAALHLGGHDIQCVLQPFPDAARHAAARDSLFKSLEGASLTDLLAVLTRTFNDRVYRVPDLLLEERRRLIQALISGVVGRYDPLYRALVQDNEKLIRMMLDAGIPVPPTFRLALEYVFKSDLEQSLAGLGKDPRIQGAPARRLLRVKEDAARLGIVLDWDAAARLFRHRLEDEMFPLRKGFDAARAARVLDLLTLAGELDLVMNLWRLENIFFDLSRGAFKSLSAEDRRLASALGVKLRFPPLAA